MNITVTSESTEHQYTIHADVTGVPNVTESRTGSEYAVKGVTVSWTYSSFSTRRSISLLVSRVWKSGRVGDRVYTRSLLAFTHQVPDWLAPFVAEHTPEGAKK